MALKNDEKSAEEMACRFKIAINNLTNFDSNTQSLKNLHFNGLLLPRLYNIWAKKLYNVWAKKTTEDLCLMVLNIDAKFEEKLTCVFKCDMRNLVNFYQCTQKSENWNFDAILLSKVQGSYKSWQWRLMQDLKRN